MYVIIEFPPDEEDPFVRIRAYGPLTQYRDAVAVSRLIDAPTRIVVVESVASLASAPCES